MHLASPSNTQASGPQWFRNKDGDLEIIFENISGNAQAEGTILKFVEEPCGITAQRGFGYIQVEFGERIGPGNRYEILRKFGWGMYSSVWLAKDTLKDRFVAIKALHGHATKLAGDGKICELDILRRISSEERETHCISLLDNFIQPGKVEEDGEHPAWLQSLWVPPSLIFSGRIAHTDLHPQNVMIRLWNSFDIDAFIKKSPAKRHLPERTWGYKFVQVAVSQPFPVPTRESWVSLSFVLGDFGSAQSLDNKVTNNLSPLDYRPPEILLDLPWDEKVDIWAFGCLVFDLINDQRLFKTTTLDMNPEIALLYQILMYTGDRFPAETIRSSKTAMQRLDPETGWLKAEFGLSPEYYGLDEINKKVGALDTPDLEGVTALLKKCLRLDPKDRFSAKELLQDPWLNS